MQEIERQAQKKWLAEEKQLNKKLQEANQRLNELQRGTKERQILNQALMAEVKQLREVRIQTGQELRKVRRNLREDVEQLGFLLKFINIALSPFIVTLVSIAIYVAHTRALRASTGH